MIDLAIAMDERTGEILLHVASCPHVRRQAEEGHPVMTMFECAEIPDDPKWHSCLTIRKATKS